MKDEFSEATMLRSVGLFKVIKEDFNRNKRDLTGPGFQALLMHRIGSYSTICSAPLRLVLTLLYRLGYVFCRNFYGIELARSTNIGRRLEIGHQHGIVIHRHATIGDDCMIRQGVTFGISNEWIAGRGPVIGNNVHFGVGSILIGNVNIGDNVTVGPHCVISADVPANTTVFLPPPRIIPKARTVAEEGE